MASLSHLNDAGPAPAVIDIESETVRNENFRTTVWTGAHSQTTLMVVQPGDDIGLEIHNDHDQFLRIEAGVGRAEMGPAADPLQTWDVSHGFAVFVPAGQ
ncbi:hypothetical protein [Leucobacter komagatae]|uniref:hypothetical protein n=1 Tax=Leucobacter komagatae TaxID=55969 RepID=UPI001FEC74D0|nr:hypothetical protein [Leucobacter komagatae]